MVNIDLLLLYEEIKTGETYKGEIKMKWIYVNIFGWILRIAFAYLMFVALLSYAYIIAIGAMFAIYYIEFFEGIICRSMRKHNKVIC